jgi:hypothetical protein
MFVVRVNAVAAAAASYEPGQTRFASIKNASALSPLSE